MSATQWTLSKADLRGVQFHVQPVDAGQNVEISYGLWADGCGGGLVIRCYHDQSSGLIEYTAAEAGESFEPWNGLVEIVGDYQPLTIR